MRKPSARTAPSIVRALAGPVCVVLSIVLVAGCAAAAGGTGPAGSAHAPSGAGTGTHLRHGQERSPARPPAHAKVIVRQLTLKDGHLMTVATFTGGIRFVLHCGSADPGRACRGKVAAGPAVGADRRLLVAAFDGGFKLKAHAGGYEQEGKILSPLVPGRASLVIDRSGKASVGIWGQGVPQPGQQVYSVRQNLTLLVRNGRPTPAAVAGWGYWGGTITGVEKTARSALGENAKGQLIYVASMAATPPDLAVALVKAGAVIGMELDINAEWVQLAYSAQPGGPLLPGVTGQVRPADQYLRGWTRDFIAVVAEWPGTIPGRHTAPWPAR